MSATYFIIAGLITLVAVWIPLFIRGSPLTVPMIAVIAGVLLPLPLDGDNPIVYFAPVTQHVMEVVLLAAIYGAGLKVDRPFSVRRWTTSWRLLGLVMPLSVILITAAGMELLALPVGAALTVAAILAPTDPVLASDIQVGPPGTGEEDDVRFGLTTEAGLNDGIMFPFVIFGVMLMNGEIASPADIFDWGLWEFAYTLGGGVLAGAVVGNLLAAEAKWLPERLHLSTTNNGLVGLAIAFVLYGLCELAGVNGFVAVFCQAIAVRNLIPEHGYHRRLAHTTEQIEMLTMVFIMVFFGFSLSHGLLDGITWIDAAFAVIVLLLIRPVTTILSLLGGPLAWRERASLGYFGIRGIGSLFYMEYLVANDPGAMTARMLSVISLTVLISVVLYGATGRFVVDRLLEPRRPSGDEA